MPQQNKELMREFDALFNDFFQTKGPRNRKALDEVEAENSRLNKENYSKTNQIHNQSRVIQENQAQISHLKELLKGANQSLRNAGDNLEKMALENKGIKSSAAIMGKEVEAWRQQSLDWENAARTTNAQLDRILTDIVGSLKLSDYYLDPKHWLETHGKIIALYMFKHDVTNAWNKAFE